MADPLTLKRRHVLQGLGAVAAGALGACGSDEKADPSGAGGGAVQGGGGTGGSSSSSSAGQGGSGGSPPGPPSCVGNGGLSPQELLAPIDTVVVLMMENRSFDHYFGGSLALTEGRSDVVGLSGSESNPNSGGGDVSVFHMLANTPADPPHHWAECHAQWNMGANDGFVLVHAGPYEDEVMGYLLRAQLPVHHALADAYTVCNHYYCSVLSATWINRFYLHGATSQGFEDNTPLTGFVPIWDTLLAAGLTCKNYHHGVPWALGAYGLTAQLATIDQFKQDAADGTLPNFSIIDPQFFNSVANDDHPSNAAPAAAQLLISDVYTTLAQSPQWDRCLFVVTYDEHGGFYDHVPPPTVYDDYPQFDHLGFRVPCVVTGPYVRGGCAVNTVYDHVSILATLRTRWALPNLNLRMAQANDLSDCIDPDRVKNADPAMPVMMPQLSMNLDAIRRGLAPGTVQHPEILRALRDRGIYQTAMRGFDPHRTFQRQLDHCVRRGLVRLIG